MNHGGMALDAGNSGTTSSRSAEARHYTLVCSACGRRLDDDGVMLDCPGDHSPALLQTEYGNRLFKPDTDRTGLFRYQEWLPVVRIQADVGGTAVYRSRRLANALGLPNLWIAFNGFWPERGARLETATFKELEAYTVLGRVPGDHVILTIASSGNTGAAFAWACSLRHTPCLIIVPARGFGRLKFREPLHPCVNIVVLEDSDYPDAIELASRMCRIPPFEAEGGVKNVGRRDGLATVLLAAFEEMQCLPSHYFQAVGSGTGAIAVLEAARRLRDAPGCATLPRLMLCQNLPFAPIYEAWHANRESIADGPAHRFRDAVRRVCADELTNWAPPYGVRGGVYDSLIGSKGDVLVADNASVRTAMNMFLILEGIDIEPAAGVALACLRDAVAQGKVDKESTVLLNVTGGGRNRLGKDHPVVQASPQLRLTRESIGKEETAQRLAALCARNAGA